MALLVEVIVPESLDEHIIFKLRLVIDFSVLNMVLAQSLTLHLWQNYVFN
jgi:hypothetical protein